MQIELTDRIAARVNACETDASNNRMFSYKLNLRLMNFSNLKTVPYYTKHDSTFTADN
jgi:hypothetical protein